MFATLDRFADPDIPLSDGTALGVGSASGSVRVFRSQN
jgi:hypothetical protein